jgi:predicted RNase H-like nuclease
MTHRGPELPYSVVAGVVPWGKRWVVASAKMGGSTFACEPPKAFDTFIDVLSEKPAYATIVVHAPIGYRNRAGDPQRTCDILARELLGHRRSTAPPAPCRDSLADGASLEGAHLDAVTITLLPRYREVYREMSPYRQRTVYSGNPELSFFRLNADTPLRWSKNREEGVMERRSILDKRIQGFHTIGDAKGLPQKQLLDASALMWSARLVFAHAASRLPADAEWDSEGLRTEWVF